jgi:hypothetical protein
MIWQIVSFQFKGKRESGFLGLARDSDGYDSTGTLVKDIVTED